MKKRKIWYRFNYSIKKRMLIIYAFLVIIPSTIFFTYFMRSYSKYALNAIITEKRAIMEEINKNISSDLNYYNGIALSLYYTKDIKNYIDRENYDEKSGYVTQFLSSIVNSDKYISSIVLDLGNTVYSIGYQYTNMDKLYEEYKEEIINSGGKGVWIPTKVVPNTRSTNTKHFVYARSINSKNHSNVGTLWIFFSDYFFDNALSNSEIKSSSEYYIVSPDKTFVTSNNKRLIASMAEAPYINQVIENKNGYMIYYNEEKKLDEIIVFTTGKNIGWTFVTVTNKDIVFKDIYYIKNLAQIILVSYIIFLALGYICMSKFIFIPLEQLSKGMNRISDGDFKQKLPVKSKDEIGMLTANYNIMIDKISNLMDDIRHQEQIKNEERLKILSMQISPHFTYNTLNTIKWMAIVNKQPNIEKMIEALINLMRTVSHYSNEEIPLEKEIDLLESYVYIQKSRYMNFDMEYDIPKELNQYYICGLILQPLIENSILYAFKEKSESGKINISARLMDALYIEVADNGKGFDIKKLEEGYQKSSKADHIGIYNVDERIKMNYGTEYGVTVQSVINKGTKITLRLPILTDLEVHND